LSAKARIGIIGCGAIASEIVKAAVVGMIDADIVALMDIYPERCERLAKMLEKKPAIHQTDIDEFLKHDMDYVVEAASQEAVREYGEKVLRRGINFVVLSVGALLDAELLERLRAVARDTGAHIYAPTGAIAGLDAIRALRLVGINRVALRTIKPPKSLGVKVSEPTVLYRGPAREAVKKFPFNVNVAAALSLAAGKEAEVEVVADPNTTKNTHVIIVESVASRLEIKIENTPSPENPRTSWLAALSVIELLRRLTGREELIIGS
jgi:aspartate dehydrogenase